MKKPREDILAQRDIQIGCPFCGEQISIVLDLTAGPQQEFIYDCEVCCRPIKIKSEIDSDGDPLVTVEQE